MLVKDPSQRISMPGIMAHPWFNKASVAQRSVHSVHSRMHSTCLSCHAAGSLCTCRRRRAAAARWPFPASQPCRAALGAPVPLPTRRSPLFWPCLQNMPPGLLELNARVDPEAASRQVCTLPITSLHLAGIQPAAARPPVSASWPRPGCTAAPLAVAPATPAHFEACNPPIKCLPPPLPPPAPCRAERGGGVQRGARGAGQRARHRRRQH